ncbi:MAG: hypothetical protein IKR51_07475 [Oscillospiraceae bacterium]|nr:hypothetical protein [Oscillospiraceae bacterium]
MATVQTVFEVAMGLIDELAEPSGAADCPENREYAHRTPAIVNALQNECLRASSTWAARSPGERPVLPRVTAMSQELGLDEGVALGVLPYGLAAHLVLDEDPSLAGYFSQRYSEQLAAAARAIPARAVDIERVYGGIGGETA